jgi:hypothetical protein
MEWKVVKQTTASCVLGVSILTVIGKMLKKTKNNTKHVCLFDCLLKYLQKARMSGLKNIKGVPAEDVLKVLVPILHCPLRLVNKLLTRFLEYAWQKVLLFHHRKMTWYGINFKRWMSNSHHL